MIVKYEKAVQYLVEAYKNALEDGPDFVINELNEQLTGGGYSVLIFNEDTYDFEIDDDHIHMIDELN